MKEAVQQIHSFEPYNEQEAMDKQVMLQYMATFDDIFYRENVFAHMTSSPWIINKDATKVLMIYHNIYDSWGWCGGHCDGDEDLCFVAMKEGIEETGLSELTLVNKQILALDILPVPPHVKRGAFVSAHIHLNLTYLYLADEDATLSIKPDENSGVRWVSVNEIDAIVTEADMKPVYHKLVKKAKMAVQNRVEI